MGLSGFSSSSFKNGISILVGFGGKGNGFSQRLTIFFPLPINLLPKTYEVLNGISDGRSLLVLDTLRLKLKNYCQVKAVCLN